MFVDEQVCDYQTLAKCFLHCSYSLSHHRGPMDANSLVLHLGLKNYCLWKKKGLSFKNKELILAVNEVIYGNKVKEHVVE